MSTPHNFWLQGKRSSSSEYFEDRELIRELVQYAKNLNAREYNSPQKVPTCTVGSYRFNNDGGLPQKTIWRVE